MRVHDGASIQMIIYIREFSLLIQTKQMVYVRIIMNMA